jgi:hypothetical protein
MNRFVDLARKVRLAALAVLGWLVPAVAWAQVGTPNQPVTEEAPPYVVSYAVVVLCIGLGVTIVLNSSRRRERAKPEVFGEPK